MIASIANSYATAPLGRLDAGRSPRSTFGNPVLGSSSVSARPLTATQALQKSAVASFGGKNGQPDFTNMTMQEFRDWTNDQTKSGKMSFEDGAELGMMFGRIPVEGSSMDDGALATEKLNFINWAQNGIAGAQSRGDQREVTRLQKALAIMGGGQASGKTDDTSTAESSLKLKAALDAFKKEASMTPAQRARRDVLKTMNLTEDAIKAMPPEQQKAIEQKIAAEVARRLRLGESAKGQTGSVGDTKVPDLSELSL